MSNLLHLYNEITQLYNNPIMYKLNNNIQENNQLSSSIYYTKIKTMLAKDSNLLYANVELDTFPIGTPRRLNDLVWKCFQTRSTEEHIPFQYPLHIYQAPLNVKTTDAVNIHSSIRIKERTDSHNIYTCDVYPISVIILHKNDSYHYRDTGTIFKSLELYNTLIIVK